MIEVMTAQTFNIDRPMFHAGMIQPKLDGVRCVAFLGSNGHVYLQSRSGKIFTSMPHIEEAVRVVLEENPRIVLDGELYTHGLHFYEMIGSIKRNLPCEDSANIQYHLYDLSSSYEADLTYVERKERLEKIIPKDDRLVLVETSVFNNLNEMLELHQINIDNGYEGSILRNPKYAYQKGIRSAGLLKYKPSYDEDFRIVGVEEGIRKFKGCGIFVCEMPNKIDTFKCVMNGPIDNLKIYWRNKENYIGKLLAVEHYGITKNGVPMRHRGLKIKDEYDV